MIHSLGPINVRIDFEISRYKLNKFLKTCKNRMFYLTSRDAKTVRRPSWGLDTSDRYFDQEHLETNQKFKNYGSNSGSHVFGDLDL